MNWHCRWIRLIVGLMLCAVFSAFGTEDCEPCEEPEDPTLVFQGADPCRPKVEGAEVDNEPCKECDGAGGIQNKDDGASCKVNGKDGVCCDGVCYEVPGETEDPCDWASGNQGKFSQAIQDEVWGDTNCYGYVVCINGETTECIVREHIEDQNPNWTEEMINCVCVHELNHINAGANCPPCGYGVGTFPDAETKKQGECEAYKAQWECLDDIEPETELIRSAKNKYFDYMLSDLNCPVMPDPLN